MNGAIPFAELLSRLRTAGLVVQATPAIGAHAHSVTCDSREVTPGSCFVAVRGVQHDGAAFIDHAITQGAAIIVSETSVDGPAPHIQVHDAARALALCAAAWQQDAASGLRCIGVTGTNGKTTTAWLLYQVLSALDGPSGLIGTITYDVGLQATASTLTTPAAPALHALLRQMVNSGCQWCVMEVSSHALEQQRVYGIPYRAGIFTNLQHDHLDYHKNIEAYAKAKKRLFDQLSATATAVYNADDGAGRDMVGDTQAEVVSYGRQASADIRFTVLEDEMHGMRLRLDGSVLRSRLSGTFNAYNLAAAYAAACARGFAALAVRAALSQATPAPGRFEPLSFDDGTTAIVDYAHTPHALENALATAREVSPAGALWCIFGCGGDRDKQKRPKMGAIAERLADYVVVTSDNLRGESFRAISRDIERGMRRPGEALWIEDRREAIGHAAKRVAPGDVILIAGKGHETGQTVRGNVRPMNDRQLVLEAFAPRGYVG